MGSWYLRSPQIQQACVLFIKLTGHPSYLKVTQACVSSPLEGKRARLQAWVGILLPADLGAQLLLNARLVTQTASVHPRPSLSLSLSRLFQEVEPMCKESDHIHIIALAQALNVSILVEYMDRGEGGATNPHVFPEGSEPKVYLLYRPGHYDILYK